MSRLSVLDNDGPPPASSTDDDGTILRQHRRRPLHPDTIHDLLRARAARSIVQLEPTPYGWKLILWMHNGEKRFRNLSPDTTYSEATRERDREMASGDFEKSWLIRKTEPGP